jgi:uncharacterized protein
MQPQPPAPLAGEILRVEVGSTVHGIGIGSDDLDLMGVFVEPPAAVTGLERLEHHILRSAAEGQRSGPGDWDLTCYGLRKLMRLATQGNPTGLLLFFAPDAFVHHRTPLGEELRAQWPLVVSQRCRPRFLGYLRSQRERAVRGAGGFRRGSREGRAAKWAAHMVRLGFEGAELLETGWLTLPMPDEHAAYCRAVKRGEVPVAEALAVTEGLERRIAAAASPLPPRPDLDGVQRWMHAAYLRTWERIPPDG